MKKFGRVEEAATAAVDRLRNVRRFVDFMIEGFG
jgi:hypothetical protein